MKKPLIDTYQYRSTIRANWALRWEMEVFKSEGLSASISFLSLPLPHPPSFIFWHSETLAMQATSGK